MSDRSIAELWEWAEYYCPWCYVMAVRVHHVQPEYAGRVLAYTRFFPLELLNHEPPPRDVLEQEWWLAAIQEPDAAFVPYTAPDWPTTTLPAFEAVWAAQQQGMNIAMNLDLAVRRAFFGESRNIGDRGVLLDIARAANLDFAKFERDFASPAARAAVAEESRIGREQYRVRGTPTMMLSDGTRLRTPVAMAKIRNRRIVSVPPLTHVGEARFDATRALFEDAIEQHRARDISDVFRDSTIDSFPASDAPSWSPLRIGAP
jgi:predicted DsbA family dithiol-disulfide isomerase